MCCSEVTRRPDVFEVMRPDLFLLWVCKSSSPRFVMTVTQQHHDVVPADRPLLTYAALSGATNRFECQRYENDLQVYAGLKNTLIETKLLSWNE